MFGANYNDSCNFRIDISKHDKYLRLYNTENTLVLETQISVFSNTFRNALEIC